eukprot:scaffold1401_cov330-Pavlova_lutheri.AAC.171
MVSLNAWVWSTVFHSRDTYATEKLDYLSAILVVYFGLYRTLVRVFELKSVRTATTAGLAVSCLYCTHIYYLLRIHFDYGLNIVVCTTNGILQLSLLLGWAFYTNHSHRNTLLAATILLYAATLLEIFDFPPFFQVFDAHSLWHFLSLPAPYGCAGQCNEARGRDSITMHSQSLKTCQRPHGNALLRLDAGDYQEALMYPWKSSSSSSPNAHTQKRGGSIHCEEH